MIPLKTFDKKNICPICNSEFNFYHSLRIHSGRCHKINSNQFYVNFYLNGNWQLCKCGCNKKVRDPKIYIKDGTEWQQTYIRGHISRIKNNWGHNLKARENSKKSKLKKYGALWPWGIGPGPGAWKRGHITWIKGLTKQTDERVKRGAEKLTGRLFTDKHKLNLSISAKNSESGKKARKINIQKALLKSTYRNNKLEQLFEKKYLNLDWEKQKYIGDHIVDFVNFKLKKVIEIYGDYWHCNPNGKYLNWLSENYNPRIKMYAKDKWLKDQQRIQEIKDNGYKVIIFWETDIKNNQNKIQEVLNQFRDASP
jgi:very-short-patch-repair endonuclease